ncbi:MAG: xanthine dehydrogenase family protein subunit M [Burkholderiales bacterium]|nr:xanthine dehydrogenase family protein subunit M [Burkholderiales bacterium]
MYAFTFERPTTQADALKLAKAGGKLLAGGQTLLASMKLRLAAPEQLVDLGAVKELAGVRKDGDALVIGAMTRHADVAGNADVRATIPALAALADGIGDKQVRAMGTLGGSVANNDPAADYPAALLALSATVVTDRREIAADDFFQGLFATALEEDELITAVRFPQPQRAAYLKFRQPASLFALIGVFVAQTAGGVRVAVTGGGNGVFRHTAMEAALDKSFTPDAAVAVTTDPAELNGDLHGSAEYRAHLVGVMAQRAVAKALG